MEKVSVIVPVYNAEEFLKKCVDSILAQTYSEMELILIDNHSQDGSLAICRQYEKNYDNVICIAMPENGGPSVARNYGIEIATGTYIGFCDSDDYIASDMYQDMVRTMETTGSDYVIGDMYAERIQSNLGLPWEDGTLFVEKEILEQMIPKYIGNESDNDTNIPVWGSVVKCLFRKSIIDDNQLMFPEELNFAEDLVFTLRYLACAKKASVLKKVYYYYRYNSNSLMNSYNEYKSGMLQSREMLINEIADVLIETGIYEQVRKRFYTTIRCYMQECIGNACKFADKRTFVGCYHEVKRILSLNITQDAFKKYDAIGMKKRIVYYLVKKKASLILTMYYRMRNRNSI